MMLRPVSKPSFLQSIRKQYVQNGSFSNSFTYQMHTSNINRDIYEINGEDDFRRRVMSSSVPVIVNFHADWCEPCHGLKPLLEKIANDNPGKIHLAEILVDDHASLLQVFEVTAVPAVLAIHRGIVTDKFIGLVSDKEIKTFVEKLLSENKNR